MLGEEQQPQSVEGHLTSCNPLSLSINVFFPERFCLGLQLLILESSLCQNALIGTSNTNYCYLKNIGRNQEYIRTDRKPNKELANLESSNAQLVMVNLKHFL